MKNTEISLQLTYVFKSFTDFPYFQMQLKAQILILPSQNALHLATLEISLLLWLKKKKKKIHSIQKN